jgi:hypothetical protein
MSSHSPADAAPQTREQRIEAIMTQLRPKIEQTVRQMVERAIDVSEAQEFGAIDFEFRDAGQKLANEVRQASLASRKKRLRRLQRPLSVVRACRQVSFLPKPATADRAWRGAAPAGLLLLRPLPSELPSLR